MAVRQHISMSCLHGRLWNWWAYNGIRILLARKYAEDIAHDLEHKPYQHSAEVPCPRLEKEPEMESGCYEEQDDAEDAEGEAGCISTIVSA